MKNLVLFGGSLLGRMGIDLMNRLKEAIPDIQIYNCAAGGINSEDGRERVDYIAKLKPDYVVLTFGANDCAPWKKTIPIKKYKENLGYIIKAFSGARVVVWLTPPVNDSNDPKGTDEFNQALEQYHAAAKEVCRHTGTHCIDSFTLYQRLIDKGTNYHIEDGIHLNDGGYEPFIRELASIFHKQGGSNIVQ